MPSRICTGKMCLCKSIGHGELGEGERYCVAKESSRKRVDRKTNKALKFPKAYQQYCEWIVAHWKHLQTKNRAKRWTKKKYISPSNITFHFRLQFGMLQTHMFFPCVFFFFYWNPVHSTIVLCARSRKRRGKKLTETHRRILFHAANLFINYTLHKWVTTCTNELKIIRFAVHKAKSRAEQSNAEKSIGKLCLVTNRPIVLLEDICTSGALALVCSVACVHLHRTAAKTKKSWAIKTHTHTYITHVGCQISAERHFSSVFFLSTMFSMWR